MKTNSIEYTQSVTRDGNVITLNKMNHPSCVSAFRRNVYECVKRGYSDIILLSNCKLVYPNVCVPIAGTIEYYKKKKTCNFVLKYNHEDDYLKKCSFFTPILFDPSDNAISAFDTLYRYETPTQVFTLAQRFIDTISHNAQCKPGVLESLTWCLSEVMDNVLLHGKTDYGYVMGQLHSQSQHVAFCIYDNGIGIPSSFRGTKHHPRTSLDAITLALHEGVGDGQGQGNGLFGLQQVITENSGGLTITSESASLIQLSDGTVKHFDNLPYLDRQCGSTTVDFQLDLNKEVDIKKAFSSIGGFEGFDIRIDNMLQDNDMLLYDVYDNSIGTATREAGLHIRNDVINSIQRASTGVILDFSKVKTVSSSFIDELISKLFLHYGFIMFNQLIRIVGMTDTIKFLCERSVYMRVHEEWLTSKTPRKIGTVNNIDIKP